MFHPQHQSVPPIPSAYAPQAAIPPLTHVGMLNPAAAGPSSAPHGPKRSAQDYEIIGMSSNSIPVHITDMTPPVLIVRQEPKQARMCGVGNKADRRPIDPPPIVELRIRNRSDANRQGRGDGHGSSPGSSSGSPPPSFQPSPYFFMFAALVAPQADNEMHLLKDGKTRTTVGSVVSSLYTLKDPDKGCETGFFVFPDLSVRTEGSYRLKLSLFEVVGSYVHYCKSVYSQPFYVYTAKKFPGMEESTALSQSLSEQGIKIRIRKDVRNRPRALIAPFPTSGTANDTGAGDGAPGDGEAGESLPKAGAKRKGAPGKKVGASKPNPRKRARTNPVAPSGIGNTGNDTPSVPPFPTFNPPPIAQDYSHLPPPSIPGGVPIDVPFHPDILVRDDEQSAPPSTTAGDGGVQGPVPVDGGDRNAQMTYVQPSPRSLPSTQVTPGASAQPRAYSRQWAQPQPPVPGHSFPPHPQGPPQVMGAPGYTYSTQQAAVDTMPPSHVNASHPMQPYSHVPIPLRPTEYTQPLSVSTNPMRPSQFPPGPISPQSFLPPSQGGLDYRQHPNSHTQPPPLAHSHQRVPSFGQTAQAPQGCPPYTGYQSQAPYSQSHSGYTMSPVGMSGPSSTLTSPTTQDDISTLSSNRSTALPSSAAYIPLSPAALESTYRHPPLAHPHGGGGTYPPGPGPTPPEASLQGHGYMTQQQTGYEGYSLWAPHSQSIHSDGHVPPPQQQRAHDARVFTETGSSTMSGGGTTAVGSPETSASASRSNLSPVGGPGASGGINIQFEGGQAPATAAKAVAVTGRKRRRHGGGV